MTAWDCQFNVHGLTAWCICLRDGTRYAGEYEFDGKEVRGCPARSRQIREMMKAIKNKTVADAVPRDHAEPMSRRELEVAMEWSAAQVPMSCLGSLAQTAVCHLMATKHSLMRAFMSTAFTLWTRCVRAHLSQCRDETRLLPLQEL